MPIASSSERGTNDRFQVWFGEPPGRFSDDLLVDSAARLEVGARAFEVAHRLCAAGFGLGHVGARHLADSEALLGRLQFLTEEIEIAFELTSRSAGRGRHRIRCHRLPEHFLFDAAQHFAAGAHFRFRLVHCVCGLEAAENRLPQLTE